jgi:hypothetical protein
MPFAGPAEFTKNINELPEEESEAVLKYLVLLRISSHDSRR